MKKILAKIVLFCLLFNLFPIYGINSTFADDSDGTANLDMQITSSVDQSSIVGSNFVYNFTLKNKSSSESTAFKNGFILSIPKNDVSFVSADTSLGTPVRTVTNGNRKLYFFETDDFLLEGSSKTYTVNLSSTNSATLLQNYDIKVLAYADDSVYGRGSVPSGAPAGTKPGGVDLANSSNDPSDLTFPDNIDTSTDLSTLPFVGSQTKFIPFDIIKLGEPDALIGNEYITNLKIKGNSLGDLKNFKIVDIIPNTRKFTGFTQTGGVGNIQVEYNTPNPGEVRLTMSDITVAQGTDLSILYKTLALAYPISSYSGSNILLNTGSYIHHKTSSVNKATQQAVGTWNDGTNNISVDATTLVPQRLFSADLLYAKLGKSVTGPLGVVDDITQAEIGNILDYTITFEVAQNVSFNTNGSGTYIEDILPDGLTFSGTVSSENSGTGNALTYESSTVDADGNTKIIWRLNSGKINAGEVLTIKYQAVLDGQFEGNGPTSLVNLQTLENEASIFANVGESGNNEEWGYTDPAIIDTQISYSSRDGNPAIAIIKAPSPVNKKYILSITEPDGTTYDSTTGMPSEGVAVGSEVEYALVMDFPNVEFSNVKVIDALPLVMGPNTEVSDYAFVPKNTKDINNNTVEYNTEDKSSGNFDNTFNSLNLTSTGWISEIPVNNIEFNLGSGSGNKVFAIKFKAKILDIKPSSKNNGITPLKNVSFASFNDSAGNVNNLDIKKVKLDIGVPELEITKTMSGSNIEAGSNIDYSVEIKNKGKASAYIENLIDILPNNLDLQSYTITGSGFTVNSDSLTQSGKVLDINFNLDNGRSVLPANSSVKIDYTVKANSGLLINKLAKTNTVTLDYYATNNSPSDGLHNYGPLETTSNFITKQPTITRTLISTSETESTGNDVEIGEEGYFETIIDLPQGTYENSKFVYTKDPYLDFLTGSIVSTSGSLSFSNGTGFAGNFADFGTIINSDNDTNTIESIVLHSTFRPKITAVNGNRYTQGRFYYNGLNIFKNKLIEVIQPKIVLTKTISPNSGDAGDTVSYTLTLNNNGNANAYDLKLKDILDSRFSLKNGTLVKDGFTGTEAEFNSNTGILLDVLNVGETKTITYDVLVNENINPNDNIPNTANLDYSSLEADNSPNEKNYTSSASVDYRVSNIGISHSLINTSNSDTDSSKNSALEDLAIGEHAFYKTTLTIPEATFSGTVITQNLPVGFKFLTGSIVLNGGISSSVSNIVVNPDNTITYTLGEVTNSSGNGVNTIDLFSELIVTDSAGIVDGANKGLSTAIASWDGGHSVTADTNLDIVEPNIVINKSVNPLIAEGGDTVTYTINLNNNGNGPAYNLKLNDILNEDFEIKPGTLALDGFTGSENDFVSSTGIILDKLLPGNSKTITFDINIKNTVTPNEVINNVANIAYSSSPEGNLPEERNYSGSSNVNLTIGDISITHELISTNDNNTGTGKFNTSLEDLAIGEEGIYKTVLIFPNSTSTGVTVTQNLPAGFKILSGSIDVNSLSHSSSNITINPDNTITFDLGNVVNDGSGGNTITIYSTVTPTDDNNISAGQEQGLSTATLTLGNGHSKSADTNLDIIEPNLVVLKDYNIVSGNGGDVAVTTITITNNGTAPAYDLNWTDTQSSKFISDANYLASSGATILNIGDTITYQYNTTLKDSVLDGETLTGGIDISYNSSPGVNSNERNYTASDFDNINVIIDGGLQATLNTANTVKIGDTSTYTIKVKVGEGTTNSLKVEDLFPTGIAIDTNSIVVTPDNLVTYTGSSTPNITGTGMTFDLGKVVNSNSSDGTDEFITITFDAVLLNTSDNNAGDIKTHNVKATFNGTDIKNATPNNVIVIEPNISLNISNSFDQVNDKVKYTFTLTNNGTASGYDLDLSSLLPTGVTYTGNLNITNSGGVINLVKSGNNFSISELPVNTGNPLTFEIYADVSENHILGENLTLTGNLDYSSHNGSYSQIISGNTDNTERNGNGGINDYKATDNTSFIYKNAILDENIVVVDDNGGDNLANEGYTYTVTLTNTGNVDLTNIPVSIDIPLYLSGSTFQLQSIPGGANSNYDANGGANNNGKLDVTGINIATGNSVTIVYKIKSEKNITDLTTINIIANVGNSPEGAIGGTPNVKINIKAPILSLTSEIIDDNGGNLFLDEILTHNTSFTNSGSAPAVNSTVVLTYNTGTVEYISGSLDFGTGVLVDNNSIVIDENAGTITFVVTQLDSNKTADFSFKTKVIGAIGTKVKTEIIVNEEKGYNTNTVSNELNVIAKILELNEEIAVVDNNGGNKLGGETFTYTVTLTNSGNIDLTGINTSIDIPEYLSGATFSLQSIPTGANSNYSQTGGINLNGKLDVTGISIPMGESKTIVYKINSKIGTPDGTHINTIANVADAIEGATGGTPNVEIIIDSPTLQVSSSEVDDNGGYLYLNDEIIHTNKIKNNGSYVASNMEVILTYDTNTVDFITGSLVFPTGIDVDNNSIVIDENTGKISFTLTSIDPNEENIITFKTKANGNVGDTVKTNISANDNNGHSAQNNSNILKIEKAILDETISVVDDNGGNNLGDEFYTYTVTLTNNGTVNLTQIPVSINIPNYLDGTSFNLITTGLTSNYSATGGVNNNGKLNITGITVPVGTSKTIVYKIKSKALTPDLTTINTIANVGNTPELAIGGNPNVEINIKAPILSSISKITDENGGDLYNGEIVLNEFIITNSGSSDALDNTIILSYNTGTTEYISGSLDYGTGVLINTGSIIVDETAGTITFIITKIEDNSNAKINFKTKVIGQVGEKLKDNILLEEKRGFTNDVDSNELIIISRPTYSGGGGGGGGYTIPTCKAKNLICKKTGNKYKYFRKKGVSCKNGDLGKICSFEEEKNKTDKELEKKEENKKVDNKNEEKIKEENKKDNLEKEKLKKEEKIEEERINISLLENDYKKYLEKKKKLEKFIKDENTSGMGLEVFPRILPKTGTEIYKRVKIRKDDRIETSLPNKNIFVLAGNKNPDLNFWKKILPQEDRNRDEYIIIPSNGLVIPINNVPKNTTDFTKMVSGKEIHVNDYLKTGAMAYPESSKNGYGEVGNKVIFGHSSYWKDDNGRYKTHFQKIIELDLGEEVWIYKKINGKFKRFRYLVNKSYNTPSNDVSVLKPGVGSNLTLFTCTPIGGIKGRWIVKAKYINEEKINLERELYGTNIPLKLKVRISDLIRKISSKYSNKKDKEKYIYKIYNKLNNLENKLNNSNKNEKIIILIKYIKLKLLIELFGK